VAKMVGSVAAVTDSGAQGLADAGAPARVRRQETRVGRAN